MIYEYRNLLYHTTMTDIKGRYAGTIMGMAWLAIYPLLFLTLYAIVYVAIFRVRFGELKPFEYVLLIFAGLVPFLNFVEVLGSGVNSVTSNSSLIKNTLFPIELIPVKAVLTSIPSLFISLFILEGALIVCGKLAWWQLFCPVIIVLQTLFCIGLCWVLSSLNVFMKDLGQIIPVISLFLMLVSPIAYTMDMVPKDLMIFMYFNPIFYLIMLYRGCLLGMEFPYHELWVFSLISIGMFFFGYYFFMRLKGVFVDEC